MPSLQESADSVRAAIGSTSTCTPEIATILGELLLPKHNAQTTGTQANSKKPGKSADTSRARATRTPTANPRSGRVEAGKIDQEEHLSPKERSILATEVINATLKALTEAIKTPAPIRRKESAKDLVKASARKALRRSNSLPQSPLQQRSLNRVSSSPSISTRSSRSSSSSSAPSTGCRPTGDCARVAFACLRSLKSSKTTSLDLPPLQLENGMSVLIGKLIALGLDDLAIKELRILKRRLDPEETIPVQRKGAVKPATTNTQALPELLEFGEASVIGENLALVITTQQHILRLMSSARNQKNSSIALPILHPSHPSSPTRLLLFSAKQSKKDKIARQFHSLSELLLSLSPSISQAEDAPCLDPRLSVPPVEAIQLQTLAFYNRILWWKYAGHTGDVVKDLFDPFLRCLTAFARRSPSSSPLHTYHTSMTAFMDLYGICGDLEEPTPPNSRKILSSIYRLLGSLAQEAGAFDGAITWTEKVQSLLDRTVDSEARQCSVTARLVGLSLRKSSGDSNEGLFLELIESLERPFRGGLSEIEDLLTEVSSVRRAAVSILAKRSSSGGDVTEGVREMCESLVFLCPRICLRYLGSTPDESSTTKDILRYEQRRQFIKKLGMHAIDSTLFLVKTFLAEGRLTWELMDSNLQTSLFLLDKLDLDSEQSLSTPSTPSYFVRISNLYFTQHLNMRRETESPKDSQRLRTLKRSIDSVRSRPQQERKASQLSTKLERMAEMCRNNGRFDELLKTLIDLRDECISNGALTAVSLAARTEPIHAAWTQDDETILLARTIKSLIKVQFKCLNASSQTMLYEGPWSDEEKGSLLEHHLDVLCNQSNQSSAAINFQVKIFHAAFALYSKKLYPIRRLRVTSRFLSLDLAHQHAVSENKLDEFKLSDIEGIIVEGTKDEGLREYLTHFQTLATSLFELQQKQPRIQVLKQCLSVWCSVRERCMDLAALERQIENVPNFLIHLEMIADYLEMKGFDSTRIAVLRLIADLNQLRDEGSNSNDLVHSFTRLGTQWLQLGYSGKAGLAFDKAQSYCTNNGIMPETLLQLHLSFSEYLLSIGNVDKSEEQLLQAQATQTAEGDDESRARARLQDKTLKNQLLSKAYLLYSMLDLEHGSPQHALTKAKQSVRLLRRAWTTMERQSSQRVSGDSSPVEKPAEEVSLNMSTTAISSVALSEQPICGSFFWPLVAPLFRGLAHLSNIYAHHGMFQETIYYAEQAHTLVKEAGSDLYLAIASAGLGNNWLKAGVLDKGSEFLMSANKLSCLKNQTRDMATLSYHLGTMHGLLGDQDAELAAYDESEAILKHLTETDFINRMDCFDPPVNELEEGMAKLTIAKKKVPMPRKTAARPATGGKRKPVARSKSPIEVASSIAEQCPQIFSQRAMVLRGKARTYTSMRKHAEAQAILQETSGSLSTQMDVVEQGLAMAKQLLCQSIEQMNADPVYSVLQESTISFPSIVGQVRTDRSSGDRLSIARLSPPNKVSGAKGRKDVSRSKSPAPGSFIDKLRQAQEQLADVYSTAIVVAPGSVLHSISALLNSVAILLSAASQVKGKPLAHPGFASCSIETVRNLVHRRERKAIIADTTYLVNICWPTTSSKDPRRSSVGLSYDMGRFQRDYIDIIPKNWTAISISLSDSRTELSITRLQAGHSPFVLRLPLGRNNSIDADEEVFGFEQGQSELNEVLRLANESAHGAQGLSGREAKVAWWEERESLDARLRDLLENIEKVWLGGFTGIFSQHARRPDLLARFQKSFQNILDKHLPSRQKNARRNTSPRMTLDSRILDLFIGLGDASAEDCDFSEPLTDLLYFVVDVLQFHGELNAYAEIDFDSIVIETHDALRGYHEAAQSSHHDEGRHTILILDKTLHAFPWESLPCMDGMPVSRLPSIGCLQQRILEQQLEMPEEGPQGKYVSRTNGSYILNPSGDLKTTQATFQKSLQSLSDWNGIIKREPTEEEMKSDLASKDILLYFGHGSGAQYIRAREIRKLEKCAVTILMGCSSGALVEAGDFEPYGPPLNYMHAGSAALVATLWDVTDKDIDRFAKSTFEHWGIFEREPEIVGKGKGKRRIEPVIEEAEAPTSLVEAVAKGRQACRLRYLTAAAVCVYGVPVYLR